MLLEERTKHPGYRTVVISLILRFLVAILRGGGIANEIMLKREETAAEANVRDFLAFLSTHYMESVSVDEAARQANVSRSHFHATFRRIAGKPFTRYLQTLRVDAAKRLLAEGIGVDEAIRRSGFTSKSNFYRIFRAITGRAPAQIRHLRPGCDT
jgi:AraC-like DNA-binding protein